MGPPFSILSLMQRDDLSPNERGWLRLHLTPGLARQGLLRLRQSFGSIEAILGASPQQWIGRAGLRSAVATAVPPASDRVLDATARRLAQLGVRLATLWDEDYPPLLAAIHDPPALLYVRGTWPPAEGLAVVGSRRTRPENIQISRQICRELAAHGIAVISGLARGIDTAAHLGALDGEGPTVAVLGCGIDRVYPPENARLFRQIAQQGTLISEYPPGAPPKAGHFPGRNRIISGLSRGVLVAEAAAGSGSLITAEFALEQGREVFALPGPPYDPNCAGSNGLLKDGAHLVTEARDILDLLWREHPQVAVATIEKVFADLSPQARQVVAELGPTPLHVDEIVRKCGLTPMEVSAILLHLELQGGVAQLPGMRYQRLR